MTTTPDRDCDSTRSAASKDSWMSTQTEVTTTTEEERVVLDASTSRNRCVSWWIIALAICGVACGIYSTLSCEWFAWTPLDDADAWGIFALDSTANQAESVGLFRFYHDTQDEDENNNYENNFGSFSCQLYSNSKQSDWILIGRKTDPWIFTAQLCWLISTILAALSIAATFFRIYGCCFCCCCRHRSRPSQSRVSCYVACGWLLASGLQAASCLAATALCGGFDFWECPWLQGAHASAGAAWFYLLCWLLSMCGYQYIGSKSLVTINHHHHHHHAHPRRRRDDNDDDEEEEKQEVDLQVLGQNKMTAEELLGTDDPIIHRAVGQKALAIREFAQTRPMEEENDQEFENTTHHPADESTATPKASNTTVLEP